MSDTRYPVGIDLGTTYSGISYVDKQGRVETVRLEDGNFAMASALYFESKEAILVGNEAIDYCIVKSERVARDFKRRMGKSDWKFEVDGKRFRPEELSAMVLRKLIDQASKHIGPIDEVVISVPFMFDEVQRRATEHAGRIAGVEVLDIVNEPVAGAIAYGHAQMQDGGFYGDERLNALFSDARILVYDLGGGTFDLTLMELKSDYSFTVKATAGDDGLGGLDWDNALIEHLANQYVELFQRNPKNDKELMQELRAKAEEAKISLSERPRVHVELTCDDDTKEVLVTRGAFEQMTDFLVERTRATLQEVLEKNELTYGHIDRIIVIGGSSRMPMIQKMLRRETGRELDISLPPDTAVSQGAALFAAYRLGDRSMEGIGVKTVNPHALGLCTFSRWSVKYVNDVLLEANQPTGTEVTKTYAVKEDAEKIDLVVLQGELPDPEDCVMLGRARIPNVSREMLEGAAVDVTFKFQQNGLLQVRGVLHPEMGPPEEVKFEVDVEGSMSEEEIVEAETLVAGITID